MIQLRRILLGSEYVADYYCMMMDSTCLFIYFPIDNFAFPVYEYTEIKSIILKQSMLPQNCELGNAKTLSNTQLYNQTVAPSLFRMHMIKYFSANLESVVLSTIRALPSRINVASLS
jgi:hypothetical protein